MSQRRPSVPSSSEGRGAVTVLDGGGTAVEARRRRRYTRRQKVTAVMAAEMTSIPAAAETSGIPETTIRYWMDEPEFVAIRAKTRDDMADESAALAHKALEAIKTRLAEFEPRDLVILFGVLVDKAQLLAGQATSRTETRDITDRMTPEQMDALADEIDTWLAERKP